jgi:hypothetical protein
MWEDPDSSKVIFYKNTEWSLLMGLMPSPYNTGDRLSTYFPLTDVPRRPEKVLKKKI